MSSIQIQTRTGDTVNIQLQPKKKRESSQSQAPKNKGEVFKVLEEQISKIKQQDPSQAKELTKKLNAHDWTDKDVTDLESQRL